MDDFTLKLKNFKALNKLFKFQLNKYNDLYIIPFFPSSSILADSGFHISLHQSGDSHLRFRYPVACLHLGPNLKLPFNKTQFLEGIATKNRSLFTLIDVNNETNSGFIAVLKTESMINNFLSSKYMTDLRENPKYIDYYNLVKTNPYLPSADFKEFFPYKELEVDMETIENSINIYEEANLYKSLIELKNNNAITATDLIVLLPYDESSVVFMSGNFIGLRINLNDIEDIFNKFPGAKMFFEMIKRSALIPKYY